jgi:hypothetical protein
MKDEVATASLISQEWKGMKKGTAITIRGQKTEVTSDLLSLEILIKIKNTTSSEFSFDVQFGLAGYNDKFLRPFRLYSVDGREDPGSLSQRITLPAGKEFALKLVTSFTGYEKLRNQNPAGFRHSTIKNWSWKTDPIPSKEKLFGPQ